MNKNNTSGITGIYKIKDKWNAQICVNYNKINLGYYENKKDAIIARLKAEKQYYGGEKYASQRDLFEQYGI